MFLDLLFSQSTRLIGAIQVATIAKRLTFEIKVTGSQEMIKGSNTDVLS